MTDKLMTTEQRKQNMVKGYRLCLEGALALFESQSYTICCCDTDACVNNELPYCCLHGSAFGTVEELHNQLYELIELPLDVFEKCDDKRLSQLHKVWHEDKRSYAQTTEGTLALMIEILKDVYNTSALDVLPPTGYDVSR